jgi:hypothetical protein
VVINYFHIFCACIRPTETDTPLIVDANTVLAGTIPHEHFKVVAWRHSQIFKPVSDLKLPKFTSRNISNFRELSDTLTF